MKCPPWELVYTLRLQRAQQLVEISFIGSPYSEVWPKELVTPQTLRLHIKLKGKIQRPKLLSFYWP